MEQERKIEKLLRAYAKKRRGQAGDSFTLDPATRQILQNEVSQKAPPSDDEDDTMSLWEVLRRNWAFFLGFAVCIFILASLFLPMFSARKHGATLSQSASEQNLRQIPGSVQPSIAGNTLSGSNGQPILAENAPAPSPTAAVSSPAVDTTAAREQPQVDSVGQAPGVAPTTAGGNFASAAAPLPAVQNSYVNTISSPSPSGPVLRNFNVSQEGDAIRVVDGDGSVYTGTLRAEEQGVNAVESGAEKKAESPKMAEADNVASASPSTPAAGGELDKDGRQAAEGYSFRVGGMNRTLKQNVVFTATLLEDLKMMKNAQMTFGMSANAAVGAAVAQQLMKSKQTNQMAQLPWSSLRIAGTAIINQSNQIHINALPAQPVSNSLPQN